MPTRPGICSFSAAPRSLWADVPASASTIGWLGDEVVVGLLTALSRVGERNSAEIARVMASYFRARDGFEPVSRDELLDRLRSGTATVLDVRPEDEFARGTYPRR